MTGLMTLSAFVSSPAFRHVQNGVNLASRFSPGIGISSTTTTPVLLPLRAVANDLQIVEACFSFFDTIKTPATLIAATTIAALFSFTRDVKDTYNISKIKVMLLRFYHVFSLLSFCLSLTTVLTAQGASTSLLISNSNRVLSSNCVDAYSFLRANMNLEFLLTRWTFAMSILSFFVSTIFRMFVEFELFVPTRRLAGTMVTSMMAGVMCSILSFTNLNNVQSNFPGLWCMTKEIAVVSSKIHYDDDLSLWCGVLRLRVHETHMRCLLYIASSPWMKDYLAWSVC